jgi:hypothetical protein
MVDELLSNGGGGIMEPSSAQNAGQPDSGLSGGQEVKVEMKWTVKVRASRESSALMASA